jgi:Protein of unknown function (DUF3501)
MTEEKEEMAAVTRSQIQDYVTYSEGRDAFRKQVMEAKRPRRIHVGPHLTFLFENALTVRYQIQEMVRAEQMVKEADIEHEVETYNELLGGPGELGASLLIEIDDPDERAQKLAAWSDLMEHVYAGLEDGARVPVTYDRRQVGESRLSSVQYVKFAVGVRAPVALGVDHPAYRVETVLSDEQRAALAADLEEAARR